MKKKLNWKDNSWTGNGVLDKLRNKAALSPTGTIKVSIEELNRIIPKYINVEENKKEG